MISVSKDRVAFVTIHKVPNMMDHNRRQISAWLRGIANDIDNKPELFNHTYRCKFFCTSRGCEEEYYTTQKVSKVIYDEYILSNEWKQKRKDCYKIHGTRCFKCKTNKASAIHHLHYDTMGDEDPSLDIMPVCARCHKSIHS